MTHYVRHWGILCVFRHHALSDGDQVLDLPFVLDSK